MKEIDIMEGGAMGKYTVDILNNFKNDAIIKYEKSLVKDDRTKKILFAIRFIFSVKFLTDFKTLPGIEIPAYLKDYNDKPDWTKLLEFLKHSPNKLLENPEIISIIKS